MVHTDRGIDRVLIVHPEAATRRSLDQALRRITGGAAAVYEAASLAEGLQAVRGLDPRVVFLDLDEERGLALEVARESRREGRLLVGLYNPLMARDGEIAFLRQAVRAGIGDFVPLPASDAELGSTLDAVSAAAAEHEAVAEGRAVVFFSHKGGVGTTTLAVNTSLALAQQTAGVALCDAVVQFGTTPAFLGLLPDRDLLDLVRDLDRIAALPAYLTDAPETALRVLASPRDPAAAERIAPEDLSRVLIALKRRFGLVVVDTPPRLDALTLAVLDLAELVVVVTEAITPTIVTTARFLELLAELGIGGDRVRVVLNRHSSFEGNLPEALVSQKLGRPVDHVVPYDKAAVVAANRGEPMVLHRPKAAFSQAVRRLAEDCGLSLERAFELEEAEAR